MIMIAVIIIIIIIIIIKMIIIVSRIFDKEFNLLCFQFTLFSC